MLAALRETGGSNDSIFLCPDGLLVGYLETEDFERARAGMAAREVNERWQREMAGFSLQPKGLGSRIQAPELCLFSVQRFKIYAVLAFVEICTLLSEPTV
jgi:hypothetical protein